MMLLCCGAPILLLGVISLLGTSFYERRIVTGALSFVCPIMMVVMIAMMFRKDKGSEDCCEHKPIEGNGNESKSGNSTL